jgi:hypothetical protein
MHIQVSRYQVSAGGLCDRPADIMDLGIFGYIEPFIALRMLILKPVAGIDGCRVYHHIEFAGAGVLFVKKKAAFEILKEPIRVGA